MQIENYIKELLYDYSKVVIPGLGAFLTSDKSAYIIEAEGKIYPPTKNIIFNDNIKLDDGVLITKIREEESLSKERAIESIQAYIEQLLTKLNADKTYTIDELGTFVKETDEYKLHFKQAGDVNYLSDIFNLPVIDLPPKIVAEEETEANKENEVVPNESFENPHESDNNLILPELTPEQEPLFSTENELIEEPLEETVVQEEAYFSDPESDPYQDNEVVNEYINTASDLEEEPRTSSSKFWWILIPLLLLGGLAYGFYHFFWENKQNPFNENKPALIEQQKPIGVTTNKSNEITSDKKEKEEQESLSSNSTGALLQGKKKNTDKTKAIETNKTVTDKIINKKPVEKELNDGYYVVISSFKKEAEAKAYCKKLSKDGYKAVVLPKSNNNSRVSIYGGKTKADAEKVLPNYKQSLSKDAWIINFKNN